MTTPGCASLHIMVDGVPATQGSKRIVQGKRKDGTPGKLRMIEDNDRKKKKWRALVQEAAEVVMAGGPPFAGPLVLCVTFYLPRPMSHWGTGRDHAKLRASAPAAPAALGRNDLSKLVRCVEDALTDAGVWRDDAQVTALVAGKLYARTRDYAGGAHIIVTSALAKPAPMGYISE